MVFAFDLRDGGTMFFSDERMLDFADFGFDSLCKTMVSFEDLDLFFEERVLVD